MHTPVNKSDFTWLANDAASWTLEVVPLRGLTARRPREYGLLQCQERIAEFRGHQGNEMENAGHSRATRQVFVANVIVTEVETEKQITGVIRNLSLFGCYVETAVPFMVG